jgi:mannosyltransferase OCH1-like enzyme
MYQRCIESWYDVLTDYKIIRWDEGNTDLSHPFLRNALRRRQWAFISDFIRMRVIYENGGTYLDADVEVIRSIDDLLKNRCFLGEEARGVVNTGVIGCVKGHVFPKICMDLVAERFDQRKPYLVAPEVAGLALKQIDAVREEVRIYPSEYFYPYNPYDPARTVKNLMYSDITDNTYAIHHWGKSWKLGVLEIFHKKLFG